MPSCASLMDSNGVSAVIVARMSRGEATESGTRERGAALPIALAPAQVHHHGLRYTSRARTRSYAFQA